jgi:threonine/homoserine/homoserine lactone efflux protein
MSFSLYATYLAACLLIVIVPGPTVTMIVANSMRFGVRAGLLNVAGTQAGLAIMIAVVGLGLTSLIAATGHWFEWIRLAGAAYLVWLGWKMFRGAGSGPTDDRQQARRANFFLQGLVVALSNPKTLLFFGAFFPQFIDPAGHHGLQFLVMGITAMVVAAASDSAYAVVAGRAANALSAGRLRLMSRIGGSVLIGGGLWLALSRSR